MFLSWDCTQIAHGEIEPRLHLPIGIFGQTDGAGLSDTLQSCGNIDAVAHQIAVALLNHIAQMDTDSKLDATFGWKAGIALDHAVLHLDGAAHGVNHAAELNDGSIAGALDHPAIVNGDYGSIRSLRSARSRASMRSSSAPAIRL
jgi:hypothetical protein